MKVKKAPKTPISSSNLKKTSQFYEEVLNLESHLESEESLEIDECLEYHKASPWVVYVEERERRLAKGNRTTEILLECNSLEEFMTKSSDNPEVRIIHPVKKEKEDSVKLYDPDNHIIEILGKISDNDKL